MATKDKAHDITDNEILKIQVQLDALYKRTQKNVEKLLDEYFESIKEKADKLFKKIRSAKTDEELNAAKKDYKQFFVSDVKKDQQFKKVAGAIATALFLANKKASEIINGKSAYIYKVNYNQIGEGLQKELEDYHFRSVTEEEAEKYGQLTKQTVNENKDEKWNRKNVMKAVTTGALLLYGVDKIIKETAKNVSRKNNNSANRQASDMMTDAENKGRLDSMYRASDEGHEVKKIWVATHDNRTRDSHLTYDGYDPVDLDFEYNKGLRRPKDSNCPFPEEVCNCRCRIVYDTTGAGKSRTRSAREGTVTGSYKKDSSFEGTRSVVIPQMTYREWMRWRSQ